ncbi:SgcJ/EcaC family oxidoreductase [Sphingomonas sp.]|uniref:YybH family protein n=1 Tax=Sphingomonas sp. TaxID=28214 RepID=UPI0035AE18E6
MMGMMAIGIALVAVPVMAAQAGDPAEAGIRAAMTASAAGWDAGDLDRFMGIYAPDAVYVGAKGLVRGKAAIADSYRASFSGGANSRGRLSFDYLLIRPIGERRMVFARWHLRGVGGEESGMTTLVFERQGGGWKIVADHSS